MARERLGILQRSKRFANPPAVEKAAVCTASPITMGILPLPIVPHVTDVRRDRVADRPVGGYRKRVLDIVVAAVALLLLAPLMIGVALAVKLSDRGPIFFGQRRIGFGNRPFVCWKFRSMAVNGAEIFARHLATHPGAAEEWARDHKLKLDPRVTFVGRFLRLSSLDELPQLWNVLRGEMSLVGPRPIVDAEIVRYGDEIDFYHATRPGITGEWQVSGRSVTSYERRVELDKHYVSNWKLRRDVGILVKTLPAVILQKGSC